MPEGESKIRLIFERQWQHAALVAVLLSGIVWAQQAASIRAGELWGVGTVTWMWLAVATAVLHQVHVWFCWRMQLHASLLTRVFGPAGFNLYAILFSILGITRVVLIFLLAIANKDSLPVPQTVSRVIAVILAVPAIYLFYSVARYFGFRRAFGIDHFDPAFRSRQLVRQGIFRYTRNGMYVFGFFLVWIPGFWCGSAAALVVAAFNHSYIWVHYFCTERPDMQRIYGDRGSVASDQ